jgi:hypothetical protein
LAGLFGKLVNQPTVYRYIQKGVDNVQGHKAHMGELRNGYFGVPGGKSHLEKPMMTWGEIL